MCLFTGTEHIKFTNEKGESESLKSIDRLFSYFDYLSKTHGNNISRLSRRVGKGVCIKSIPIPWYINVNMELVNLCSGGERGNDLLHLPFDGTILDQPNLFFDTREELLLARNEIFDEVMKNAREGHQTK